MTPTPITDGDLHAYLDGQLGAARRGEVERWLAAHPDDADRVQAWRDLTERLQAALDPVLDEPIPPALAAAARGRAQQRRWRGLALAATFAAVSVAAGWFARGWADPAVQARPAALAQRAAVAHAVYVPEARHPVEVGADQQAHLVAWLSKRLGEPLQVPALDAQGYTLIGGRLLPGDNGAVALFMYENAAAQRLTLYVVRSPKGQQESAFRFSQEGKVGVFSWIDTRCAYALSGELDREALGRIAKLIYLELEGSSPVS